MTDATVLFYDRIKDALCFSVQDFQLDMQITRRFAVLAVQQRLSHSTISNKLSTVVGVPTLVHEYSECFENSQAFAVTGISGKCYVRI